VSMKLKLVTTTLTTLAVVLATQAQQYQTNIIYYESFSGSATELLNGKVPDVSATGAAWQAGNLLYQNGHWNTYVADSANGQAAWLPFTALPNKLYILECSFLNSQPNWLAVGFFSSYPVNNSGISWTETRWEVRHSNSGYLWMLSRNHGDQPDQQAFLGYGTGNQVTAINGDLVDPNQWVNVKIVLNTGWPNDSGSYTYEYWLNDQLRASGTIATSLVGSIGGVGLSYERSATANSGADIDYFRLSVVPEPNSIALFGILLLGLGYVISRSNF